MPTLTNITELLPNRMYLGREIDGNWHNMSQSEPYPPFLLTIAMGEEVSDAQNIIIESYSTI